MSALQIERTGPQVLVQDAGRPGGPLVGIASSGAFDRASHDLANRLVGNTPHAATLEVLLGGLLLRSLGSAVLAVTGSDTTVRLNGRAASMDHALAIRAGDLVELGVPPHGLRAYVAVRGGIDGPRLLGSRSSDTLGMLGPSPLMVGDIVAIADDVDGEPFFDVAHRQPRPLPSDVPIALAAGPHTHDLGETARGALTSNTWTVDTRCDRVGIRFVPSAAGLASLPGDLPSLPMEPGCLQLPPDGHPVLLGPDAGVTGGYAVVGVVDRADLDRLAHVRPGDPVRFRWQR